MSNTRGEVDIEVIVAVAVMRKQMLVTIISNSAFPGGFISVPWAPRYPFPYQNIRKKLLSQATNHPNASRAEEKETHHLGFL